VWSPTKTEHLEENLKNGRWTKPPASQEQPIGTNLGKKEVTGAWNYETQVLTCRRKSSADLGPAKHRLGCKYRLRLQPTAYHLLSPASRWSGLEKCRFSVGEILFGIVFCCIPAIHRRITGPYLRNTSATQ
ncbi:hypothetical protein HAX54_031388, partial [Datura stramonium]|nr:hypothetical protein [Datura stramonium]